MASITVDEVAEAAPPSRIGWGWYLASGIAWFFIGLGILSVQPGTVALIGYMVAGVVLLAGMLEFVYAFTAEGWKWLHALAGVIFIGAGLLSFTTPYQTFAGLAILFGWYLVVKGMTVFIVSLATRIPGSLWGLGVAVGIANLAIGLWAIGYPARSAWLLVLWIGFGALLHGISDIVSAFQVRSAR